MKVEELIERYNRGERDFRWINLRGANLRDANLQGANLQGTNLYDANLKGTIMEKTESCNKNEMDKQLEEVKAKFETLISKIDETTKSINETADRIGDIGKDFDLEAMKKKLGMGHRRPSENPLQDDVLNKEEYLHKNDLPRCGWCEANIKHHHTPPFTCSICKVVYHSVASIHRFSDSGLDCVCKKCTK